MLGKAGEGMLIHVLACWLLPDGAIGPVSLDPWALWWR